MFVFLLLLCGVISSVHCTTCTSGTVEMHRQSQSGDEGDSITLNIELGCVLSESIFTINIAYTGGTATIGSDYTGSFAIPIPTGVSFFGTMISLEDDNIAEPDESFDVVLSTITTSGTPTLDSLVLTTDPTKQTTTVTIEDDDTVTVSINPPTLVVTEGDTDTTATVTVGWDSLVEATGFTQVLSYITGSAGGSDFTTSSLTLTLGVSPSSSIEVPIPIIGDNFVEDDEYFTVSLSTASAPTGFGRMDAIFVSTVDDATEIEIVDDDTIIVSFFGGTVDLEGETVLVGVNHGDVAEDTGFSFSLSLASGTDAESGDYSGLGSLVVGIPTSASTQTFTVSFIEDQKIEDHETIIYEITAVSSLLSRSSAIQIGSPSTVELVISDDDDGTISLTQSASAIESAGVLITTLFLSHEVEDDGFSVTMTLIDDTASAGSDYSSIAIEIPIPTCTTSFLYSVDITDDDAIEDHEVFSISLSMISAPAGFRASPLEIGTPDISTCTISDDDTGTIGISDVGDTTEPLSATATMTLTLPSGGFQDAGWSAVISITDCSEFMCSDTEFTNDYTTDTIGFPLPSTSVIEVEIPLVDNALFEDFETYSVQLVQVSAPSGYTRDGVDGVQISNTQATHTGVIVDNDSVFIRFSSLTRTVTEADIPVSFDIINGFEDSGVSLTLTYAPSQDFESSGQFQDFTVTTVIGIPADTNTHSFTIDVTGDSFVEDTETLILSFGDSGIGYPTAYSRSSGINVNPVSNSYAVTIVDDDFASVKMRTSTVTFIEGDTGDVDQTTAVTFDIDNTVLIPGFSVVLSWNEDTALSTDADFSPGGFAVQIPTEASSSTIAFGIPRNEIVEDHESFRVLLNAIFEPGSLVRADTPIVIDATSAVTEVGIIDDDTATICIDTTSSSIFEGGTSNYFIWTSDLEIEDQFTIVFDYIDGTASFTSDINVATNTFLAPLDQASTTVSVSITSTDDNKISNDKSFTVSLTALIPPMTVYNRPATSAIHLSPICRNIMTLVDDDTATLEMDVRGTQGAEGGGDVIVNVDISGGTLCDDGASLTLSYGNVNAASDDYVDTLTVLDIPTYSGSETQFHFVVPIISDSIVEDDEVFRVILQSLSQPGSANRNMIEITSDSLDQSTSVTIMDDDSATLSLTTTSVCGNEGDVTTAIGLTVDNQVQDMGFTFDLTYSDDTAISPDDYLATVTTGDIATLANAFSFIVTFSNDEIVEAEQSFSLSISSVAQPSTYVRSNAIFLATVERTSTVTIKDDDTATLSITSKVTTTESSGAAEIALFLDKTIEDPTGFTVDFMYTPKDGQMSSDFSGTNIILSIPPDPTSTFSLVANLVDDNNVEDTESFCVSIANVFDTLTSNSIRISSTEDIATVCVLDDDTATLVLDATTSVTEMATFVTGTVSVLGDNIIDSGFTVTIGYGGNADSADFTSLGEVELLASMSVMSFSISINDDTVVEDNELIILWLGDVSHPFSERTSGAVITHSSPMSVTQTITILDEDTATLSFQMASQTISESSSTVDLILGLSNTVQDPGFSLSVLLQTITADVISDFSTSTTTFPVSEGVTSITIAIPIISDEIVEDDELFRVVLFLTDNPVSYDAARVDGIIITTTSLQSTTVTIADDDTAMCSFNPTGYCETEDINTIPVFFQCDKLFQDSGFSVSFTYIDGTAEEGNDFTVLSDSLDLLTSTQTYTFDLSVLDDGVVEDDQTFQIAVSSVHLPSVYTRPTSIVTITNTASMTIKDNDFASCSLGSLSPVAEGTPFTTLQFFCTNPVEEVGFSLDINFLDMTAVDPGDFTGVTSVGVPAGQTAFMLDIPITSDQVVEDIESALVSLGMVTLPGSFTRSNPITVATATETLQINDDDSTTCSMAQTSYCENEDSDVFIVVECDNAVQDPGYSVSLLYSGETALEGNDYSSTMNLVGIPPGSLSFSFPVETLDDLIVEDTQSYIVDLVSATALGFTRTDAIWFTPSTSTVTIKDDDTVSCSLLTDMTTVQEAIGATADIEVSCNTGVEESGFSLEISFTDKDTESSSDYTGTNTLIAVPTLTTDFLFSVPIVNNDVVEDFESLCVELDDVRLPTTFIRSEGADFVDSTSVITIEDDDTATCGVASPTVCVTEGVDTSATMTVTCDKIIETGGVMIDVFYDDGDAFNPGDYIDSVTDVAIPAGSFTFELPVEIVDDSVIENDEYFQIVLTNVNEDAGFARNNAVVLGLTSGTISIKDIDSVTCSFASSDVTVDEMDGFLSVEIECNAVAPQASYSFDLEYTEGTATEPEDYTSVIGAVDFPTGVTTFSFSFSIINDDFFEDDHSFTLSVSNVFIPGGADSVFFTGSQIITIFDDDTVTCTFVSSDLCLDEDEGSFVDDVTCDKSIEISGVTFDVAYTDGSAMDGSDYTSIDSSFDLLTSTSALSFSSSILDDSTVEDDETFFITVSSIGFPAGFSNTDGVVWEGTQTVTIKDEDTATCSFHSPVSVVEDDMFVHSAIECDAEIDATVTFALITIDGTAGPGDYGIPGFSEVSANPTQTSSDVYITLIVDNIVESDETFMLAVDYISFQSGFQHTSGVQFQGSLTGTILDDDTVTCSVSLTSTCVAEEVGTITLETSCDNPIDVIGFTIDALAQDMTAVSPSDYTISSQIAIPTSVTIFESEISIIDDQITESPEETFIVVFNSGNEPDGFPRSNVITVTSSTYTLTIKDTDPLETTEVPETTVADVTTVPDVTTDTGVTTEGPTTPERTTGEVTTESQEGDVGDRNLPDQPDPCQIGNPCPGQNKKCSSLNGVVSCACATGFQAEDNTADCVDINECSDLPCNETINEKCSNTEGSYYCVCQDGYERNIGGRCLDTDECLLSPCSEYEDCANLDGSFECICKFGFQMTVNNVCEDINECEQGIHDCGKYPNSICVNSIGNFTCSCKDGYILSSTDICIPINECDPSFNKCIFPEELCFLNEFGENFCSCSPGFVRSSTSHSCENRIECEDTPDVCSAIKNSHCVDVEPIIDAKDAFYLCECNDGFVEVVTGKCAQALTFRLGMIVVAVNEDTKFSSWSSALEEKGSERFLQMSELLCSFFDETLLTIPGVNASTCSGLGYAEADSGLKVALKLSILHTGSSVSADDISTSLLEGSVSKEDNTKMWRKANGDSITVESNGINVQALEDITCSPTPCMNGGTCILDEDLYEITCRCSEAYEGEKCENDITQVRVETGPKEEVSGNNRLFIILGLAALIFVIVATGLCCLLLKSQTKSGRKKSVPPFLSVERPINMRKRPLLTTVPEVVRNPSVEQPPQRTSYNSEAIDYDDLRMRKLQQTFLRMGGLESEKKGQSQDPEDNASTSSREFSRPYTTDGSINV